MKVTPGNAQHIGAREAQQDAFGFSDLSREGFQEHAGLLAVVADGIGGLEGGEEASRTAVAAMIAAYHQKVPEESIPEALLRSADAANAAVYDAGGATGDIGTTMVAAAVHSDLLHWFSIGDSHLMLLRGGEVRTLNEEHTYGRKLAQQVEAGEISAIDAAAHPERGSLTSYLGMPELGEYDHSVRGFELRAGDKLLLASDGLTKTLEPGEISSQASCEELVAQTLAKQHEQQDNVTVLSLSIEPPPAPAPPVEPAQTVVLEEATSGRPRYIWAAAIVALLAMSWFAWSNWLCCEPPVEAIGTETVVEPPAPEPPVVEPSDPEPQAPAPPPARKKGFVRR